MAQNETLGIIEEIESLVSDKLQVVSYKWLSRSYMVSSNVAKRLLQEFVQKHGNGLEVIYTLSGWLKSSPPCYHIRLVTGQKLAEAQEEFDSNCSLQVYSVQASIPKDPAMLWNTEFIQAEELFKQPFSVDNCLRDNRFGAVSSSFVQRNVDSSTASPAVPPTKSTIGMGLTKSNTIHQSNAPPQPQHHKAHESVPKVGLQSLNAVKDVKTESYGAENAGVHDQASKPAADKEKVLPLPTSKKKVQADKSSSASGSLANLWSRASAKSKPSSPPAENSHTVSNPTATTADAQICAREAENGGSSDDDGESVTVRRSSNGKHTKKRRVVLDFSDEDEFEDAVNLASPDFPQKQSSQDHGQNDKKLPEKATVNSNSNMQQENKSNVKEEITINKDPDQQWREDFSVINKCTSTGKVSSVKSQNCTPEIDANKQDNLKVAAPSSPKRRKVLKSRIDERGREVTEVVWEGEETEANKADNVATRKTDDVVTDTVSRPPAPKKSIANTTSNPTGRGGSKKAGNSKDPKQGNILSFFKRV